MCFLLLNSCSLAFCAAVVDWLLYFLFLWVASHWLHSAIVSSLNSAKYVHCKGPVMLFFSSSIVKKRRLAKKKKRKWDPAMISMSFFTNEQLCIINTPSHNWALGRQTLCMAFLQKEKCFRLTPNEVLMAHAKWLQESIRMVSLGVTSIEPRSPVKIIEPYFHHAVFKQMKITYVC